ncbi:MAG: STAS domain-containing protein [Bacteroidales bacterium]
MARYISENNTLTCKFGAKLDTLVSRETEEEINRNLQTGDTRLVFDMQDVEYVSSGFLRLCVKYVKQFSKEHFAIINVNPTVFLVFKVANLTELCTVE